jgi:hypothetical protein
MAAPSFFFSAVSFRAICMPDTIKPINGKGCDIPHELDGKTGGKGGSLLKTAHLTDDDATVARNSTPTAGRGSPVRKKKPAGGYFARRLNSSTV